MTSLDVPVTDDGPLIEVEFGLSATLARTQLAAGVALPPPAVVTALVDTGADVTTVDPVVFAPLVPVGLVPSKFLLQNAPGLGGLGYVTEYELSLTIGRVAGWPRSGLTFKRFAVLERAIEPHLPFRVILGRDLLDQLAFLYDGPGRRLTLLLG